MHLRPLGHLSMAMDPISRPHSSKHQAKRAKLGANRATAVGPSGESGSRTHGTLADTPDFESGTFGHSVISPRRTLAASIRAVNARADPKRSKMSDGGLGPRSHPSASAVPTDEPRRPCWKVEEEPSAECPIGPGFAAPLHPRSGGAANPGSSLGHEVPGRWACPGDGGARTGSRPSASAVPDG